ncbi:unnamed protein product, partial [Prorocentrum cordatum]
GFQVQPGHHVSYRSDTGDRFADVFVRRERYGPDASRENDQRCRGDQGEPAHRLEDGALVLAEQEELDRQNRRTGFWPRLEGLLACDCASKNSQVLETVILEKTIIKLGSLLVLGFGEAGANIIG